MSSRLLAGCASFVLLLSIVRSVAHAHDYGKIELIRDHWGIPHVFAETDAGAMFGLGYAAAEDRAFQMTYTLRIIQGRLAEVMGDIHQVRRNETALDNDRKMRTFGFARAVETRVAELDDETRGLLRAYADGVNAYFDQAGDDLNPLFAKVGLVPERWTPADCLLAWWHLAQFFATDGTRDLMHYRNLTQGRAGGRDRLMREMLGRGGNVQDLTPVPQDDSAAVVRRDDVSEAWVKQTHDFIREHGYEDAAEDPETAEEGPKFSHAWVVDGRVSGTGSAVLVSMPQTPVTNPSLMYEFHICGETFDARGIGVPGSPIILIGWNQNVAWGMTALGADQADLFRLKTDDEHPGQYEFDGQWNPIRQVTEEIKVKGGRSQTLVVRETHFGPIVNAFAFSRPEDPLVALQRVPICDRFRDTIQGGLAMMRAAGARDFLDCLKGWRFPTANCLFGDRNGHIGYSTVGALPLRSAEALDQGGAAHDGSESRFGWQAIIPQELVPHVVDPAAGILFSGNHRPVGEFYPIPLGIRTGSMGDSMRSWRLRQLLEGQTSLTPQQVHDVFLDSTNPARKEIVRIGFHLRDVLQRDLSEDALAALEHLEKWYAEGAPSRNDVPGCEVAMGINIMFRFVNTELAFVYGGGESGMSHFLKTVGSRLDENPKAEITQMEQDYVDGLLAQAWRGTARGRGHGAQRQTATPGRQPAGEGKPGSLGFCQSLDGFPSVDPSLDLPMPRLACTDGATVFSQAAQAYVQWVPLDNVDGAKSLLPPGQSERADDPSRTVNVDYWSKGRLHAAPITREAVEAVMAGKTAL